MNQAQAAQIAPSRCETGLTPLNQRFELWRQSMAPLFALHPTTDWKPDRFAASAKVFHLGDLLLAEVSSRGSNCTWQDTQGAKRATPDLLMLQLQTAGQGIIIAGQQQHLASPGTLTLVNLAEAYLSEDDGFSCLCLLVPQAILAPRLSAPLPPGGLILAPDRPLGQILAAHLQTLWKTLPSLSTQELPIATQGLLAAVATAFTPTGQGALGATPETPRTIALFHHIDRHLQEPLDVEQLCQRFGYSRSALYRLFTPYGGIGAYRQQRRLAGSFRELRSPLTLNRSIAEIALRWGFTDQSHFSRAFRAAFGRSPSQIRASALITEPRTHHFGIQSLQFPSYRDWLETL